VTEIDDNPLDFFCIYYTEERFNKHTERLTVYVLAGIIFEKKCLRIGKGFVPVE
jgi:hypothetical protein